MPALTTSISINQIKYAIALHESGSFSVAADQCYISQSTLSTMIKKLENQIDMQLFDRSAKPIKLTTEGQSLINQFKVLHNEYENLIDQVQEVKKTFYGTMKIGIIPTLAPFLLPLILTRILENHPRIEFTLHEIPTEEIIRRLKLRELDLGILSLPIDDKEFSEIVLFEEDFLVYDMSNDVIKNKFYRIKDIEVTRLWLLEESHCMSNQIGKICNLKKNNIHQRNLNFNSGSLLSLLELVNIKKGITLLPRLVTLQDNLINRKHLFPIEQPIPVRQVGLLYNKFLNKDKLIEIIKKEIDEAVKPLLQSNKISKVIKPF